MCIMLTPHWQSTPPKKRYLPCPADSYKACVSLAINLELPNRGLAVRVGGNDLWLWVSFRVLPDHSRQEPRRHQEIPECEGSQMFPSVTPQTRESQCTRTRVVLWRLGTRKWWHSGVPCLFMPLSLQTVDRRRRPLVECSSIRSLKHLSTLLTQ